MRRQMGKLLLYSSTKIFTWHGFSMSTPLPSLPPSPRPPRQPHFTRLFGSRARNRTSFVRTTYCTYCMVQYCFRDWEARRREDKTADTYMLKRDFDTTAVDSWYAHERNIV